MNEIHKKLDSDFKQRLKAARNEVDPDQEFLSRKEEKEFSELGIAMKAGVEMVSALLVGVSIGWGLDFWLKTKPLLLIVFFLLGGAAGILNVWRTFRSDIK